MTRPFSPKPRNAKPARRAPANDRHVVLPRNVFRRGTGGGARALNMVAKPTQLCGLKQECGSCAYVNDDYNESLATKFEKGVATLEATGVVPRGRILQPRRSPKEFEYRSLFKLAVRASRREGQRFQIGLFAPATHSVVDMDQCPLHAAPLRALIRDLRAELEISPITPFDETAHTGQLRYVAARSAHLTGELILTFVVTESIKVELKRLVHALQRKGHKINSAHMNLNLEKGNAIFGSETTRLVGSDRLRERLCDLDFEVGPTSFFQVNPWQAINLYRRIEQIAGAPGKKTVAWDLYCGTGQIALVLARLGYRVLGIEENPSAIDDARLNARKNNLDQDATFIAARVEDSREAVPSWAAAPELIVVNPSRRGLADPTRKHLARLLAMFPESRFVYVSCEVETLARDLKELTSTGFQVRQVEPFDMFPQTDNMEWLVVMTR